VSVILLSGSRAVLKCCSVVYGSMHVCMCALCRVMLCSSSLRPHQPLKQSCASS